VWCTHTSDKAAALANAFVKIDAKYNEKVEDDGTTAVRGRGFYSSLVFRVIDVITNDVLKTMYLFTQLVALITSHNELIVAHVGDTRCVVVDANSVAQITVRACMRWCAVSHCLRQEDHKPANAKEKARIEKVCECVSVL
jgi:hypothetical protein